MQTSDSSAVSIGIPVSGGGSWSASGGWDGPGSLPFGSNASSIRSCEWRRLSEVFVVVRIARLGPWARASVDRPGGAIFGLTRARKCEDLFVLAVGHPYSAPR
jgi:hypothetical protein